MNRRELKTELKGNLKKERRKIKEQNKKSLGINKWNGGKG